MKSPLSLLTLLVALATLTLSSCSSTKKAPAPNPEQKVIKSAQKVNPHPSGSYEHFKFESYPYTSSWKNNEVLAKANPSNTSVKIDLSMQRGFLMVGDQIAMDYRVSTGSSSHKTPTGNYKITEKIKDKRSNLYGKVLNSSGGVVKSNADSRKDKVPAGGKFLPSPGTLDETSMLTMDRVLALANQTGVRLIFPLLKDRTMGPATRRPARSAA